MHWFRRPAILGDHYDRSVLDELRFSLLFQDLGLNFVNNLRFADPDNYGFKSTRRIANLDIILDSPTATCYFGTAAVAGNGRDGLTTRNTHGLPTPVDILQAEEKVAKTRMIIMRRTLSISIKRE